LLREYVIISRGGQGGVTASRILASAAVIEGKYAQAIPEFGAERRGAIVRSYLRISDEPIKRHSAVKEPQGVAVFSSRIFEIVDPFKYIPRSRIMLVNASKKPAVDVDELYCVDATSIAVELGLVIAGWPVVNTAMAAAMAKVFNISTFDSLSKALEDFFHGRLLEVNKEAAKRAWSSVQRCQ